MRPQFVACLSLLVILCGLKATESVYAEEGMVITPPTQPATGPGGNNHPYEAVVTKRFGEGRNGYWIAYPKGVDQPLPVVGFLHGWGVFTMQPYQAWVNHIVRRGNIVIYPQYMESYIDNPADMTGIAGRAVADAFTKLGTDGIPTAIDGKFALVGHSLGGCISANFANDPEAYGVPKPLAVMPVEPGDSRRGTKIDWLLPKTFKSSAKIPAETLLLVVVGEDDRVVNNKVALRMFKEAKQVPLENRDFVTFHTDPRGMPPLRADHFIPLGFVNVPEPSRWAPNAYDYLGLWKLFDGLTDAAFYGKNREYALGNTPQQRSLGTWSDGVPVKELTVTDKP